MLSSFLNCWSAPFWLCQSLNGPRNFRIEHRPAPSLPATPHKESCSGAVGALGFDIYQRMIVAKASRYPRKGQTIQDRRCLNGSRASHRDWACQRHLRLFEHIPCGKPIADTKVKSAFEPAGLPVDRNKFTDQIRRQFTIKILLLLKGFDRRRSILIRREPEAGHALDDDQLRL